ncbi:hypothetical protein SK128_016834 [Halocaridina rubra]|uniref:Uncharacterized protein n=1 Tax=Halocaridina rubra TaxID=373956 RepID=A0AAN8WQ65_HALRR
MKNTKHKGYGRLNKNHWYIKAQLTRVLNGLKQLDKNRSTDTEEVNCKLEMTVDWIRNIQDILGTMEAYLIKNDLACSDDGEMTGWAKNFEVQMQELDLSTIKMPELSAPHWERTPKNFRSWKMCIDQYFESVGVTGNKEILMIV